MYEDYSDGSDIERPRYEAEYKAFERAGAVGIIPDKNLRNIQDPLERFQTQVDGISRSLTDNAVSITESDITKMLEKATVLNKVEHKNPTAYVLGFLASTRGSKITETSTSDVFNKILPYVKDRSVNPEDVLRYARLWLTL